MQHYITHIDMSSVSPSAPISPGGGDGEGREPGRDCREAAADEEEEEG